MQIKEMELDAVETGLKVWDLERTRQGTIERIESIENDDYEEVGRYLLVRWDWLGEPQTNQWGMELDSDSSGSVVSECELALVE